MLCSMDDPGTRRAAVQYICAGDVYGNTRGFDTIKRPTFCKNEDRSMITGRFNAGSGKYRI